MTRRKLRALEWSKTKIYLMISLIENNKSIQTTREEIIFERKLKSGLKIGPRAPEAHRELREPHNSRVIALSATTTRMLL